MRRIYSKVLAETHLVSDPSTRSLVSRILATSTYAVSGIVALGTLGIDTSPVLAAMGVSGATLGFACKDIGANVVAGLSLAAQRPFEHGQKVSIGTAHTGTIDHWDTRYLYLRGANNELIHVPNSVVFTQVLTVHNPKHTAFERDGKGDIITEHSHHVHNLLHRPGHHPTAAPSAHPTTASAAASTTGQTGPQASPETAEAAMQDSAAGVMTILRLMVWVVSGVLLAFGVIVLGTKLHFNNAITNSDGVRFEPVMSVADKIENGSKRALTWITGGNTEQQQP